MRPLRLLVLLAVLAVFLILACAGTDVTVQGTDGSGATVQRTEDGTSAVVSGGGELPPVVVDKDGVHEFPTPEPQIAPVYPVTPPAPTKTPKPS